MASTELPSYVRRRPERLEALAGKQLRRRKNKAQQVLEEMKESKKERERETDLDLSSQQVTLSLEPAVLHSIWECRRKSEEKYMRVSPHHGQLGGPPAELTTRGSILKAAAILLSSDLPYSDARDSWAPAMGF